MKNIVVLGCGLVGRVMAEDLSLKYHVASVDISQANLDKLKSKHVKKICSDVSDLSVLQDIIKDYDLVVGALPGFMGYETMKRVIMAKKNIVDISFYSEDPFELDKLAKENDVVAVMDCGVAPGMGNIIFSHHDKMMKITDYECLVGGLPKKREWPFEYQAVFSPIDVIEEYIRPARMMIDSKVVTKAALSDLEIFSFSEVGELEAFNTDGLRSLLQTMKHIPNMKEKTLRYPGHAKLIQSMIDEGLFDNNNFDDTVKKLFKDWKLEENEPEFTVLDINIYSKHKNIHYHLYDETDIDSNTSSMARTTGYTATATVNMLINNLWVEKGVYPPEKVGKNHKCFEFLLNYLMKRNIKLIEK